MRRRASPWRWVGAWACALAAVAALVAMPEAWLDRFFSPLNLEHRQHDGDVRPWLELLPPPALAPAASPTQQPPPPRQDPAPPADWWNRAWRVRVADDLRVATAPTAIDSSLVVLDALGLPSDLAMIARPDSVMAARLLLMQREDGFRFDALKPYWHAMTRAAAYQDIQSRAADMYDDFLHQSIAVTPRRDP